MSNNYISKERVYELLSDLMAESGKEAKIMLSDAKEQVYQEQSADVVEVKHGKWIKETVVPPLSDSTIDVVTCSACGIHLQFSLNYCPYCGAKMDGGK